MASPSSHQPTLDVHWFIKEVRSIYVRNLYTDGLNALQSLPSPKLEILAAYTTNQNSDSGNGNKTDGKTLLFTSNAVYETCNPSWTTAGLRPEIPLLLQTHINTPHLTLRFYDARSSFDLDALSSSLSTSSQPHSLHLSPPQPPSNTSSPPISTAAPAKGILLLEYNLDLSKIVRLGQIQLSNASSLPANSIFLSTDNGYYVDENLSQKLRQLKLLPPVTSRNNQDDEYESDIIDTTEIINRIKTSNENIEKLRDRVDKAADHFGAAKLEVQRLTLQAKLDNLSEEIAIAEAEAALEEEAEAAERELLRYTLNLEGSVKKCEEIALATAELNKTCERQREDLIKTQFFYEARQVKLISDLQSIYPIDPVGNGSSEYSIRGIELPMDLSQRDDEQTSSALGYLVHLLLLTSKYLEVPLRYQLLFFASRSMIRDPIQNNGMALPLYRRGIERERFDCAIKWLQRNIEQILQMRGIAYDSKRSMLYNLQLLFECEICPTLAI